MWRSINRHAAPDGTHPRRWEWQAEALFLIAVAAILTLVFAYSSLDVTAARLFYRRDALDHWPFATQLPWSLLYRSAPWITALLLVIGLGVLGASWTYGRRQWRRHGLFVLLTVVLGPGLLANGVFKDHWQHPRPRDIVEFGGPLQYVPSPLIGSGGGASFPCGHCTVGFLYGLGWWSWRRRRPACAKASVAAGLVLGSALGIGRMAAGGHFLSDILWSAVLAFGVSHILYYHALRIPQHAMPTPPTLAARVPDSRWLRAATLVAVLGAVCVLAALFAVPHGRSLTAVVPLASLPASPRVLEVDATQANITIVLVDPPTSELSIEGELHGFGLPTSRLDTHVSLVREPVATLRYTIEQHGWFTDLDGRATLRMPAALLQRLVVNVRHGNVQVIDMTQAHVCRTGALRLELHTGDGHVQLPEAL